MSDIGAMVAELIAAGCSPDVAASVVAKAYVAGVGSAEFRGIPVDEKAEKRRAYDRERKRKSAEIRRNSTESAETPILPLSSSNTLKESKRGTRLNSEWKPSDIERGFAKELGWSNAQIDSEAANFRDYWIAKPGSGGVKLDWTATWRKWIRSSKVKPAGLPAQTNSEQASGFYAKFGSPEQDAWDNYRRATEGKPYPRDAKGGWQHPTQWPPGYEPAPPTDPPALRVQSFN